MQKRIPTIEIGGRKYTFVTRHLVQASSSGVSCGGTKQTNIEQSEGPFPFQSPTGGAIRVKNFFVALFDATPAATLVGCTPIDGVFAIQLAQSSSGPYVTVLAQPVKPSGSALISTQGLYFSWNPEPETADLNVFDWNPVQQQGAPFWQTIFNVDLWNSDAVSHSIVLETSLLVEEYQEDMTR